MRGKRVASEEETNPLKLDIPVCHNCLREVGKRGAADWGWREGERRGGMEVGKGQGKGLPSFPSPIFLPHSPTPLPDLTHTDNP